MNRTTLIIKSDVPAVREPIPPAPEYGNIDPFSLVFKDDFAFVDTETTGIDPDADAIVEIALVRYRNGVPDVFHSLVNPGFPIPPTASAVHNIVDDDVKDAPTLLELRPKIEAMLSGAIRSAHNAKFDALFVDPAVGEFPDSSKWLCTYRLARHVMPQAPAFGNNVLRYWLKTNPKSEGLGAHRAIDDVYVSIESLFHMLKLSQAQGMTTLEQVRLHANEPIVSSMIPFGKHVGKDFSEVPTDYFEWALLTMVDLDPDLKFSFEREIVRRPDLNTDAFDENGKVKPAKVMTSGKHKGELIKDVPTDYFQFLIDKGIRIDPVVKIGIDLEMARRRDASINGAPTVMSLASGNSSLNMR